MKKKTAVIICVVLAFLIVAGCITWGFLPHPLNYNIGSVEQSGTTLSVVEKTDDSVTVKKSVGGDIRVLMFTDTHLDGKNNTSKVTVTKIVENVLKEKPDLVIFGGDIVTSGLNGVRCRQLGKIFEKLGVYWAGVLGNHEGDNPYSASREKMMDIYCSFPHCLMRKGLESVTGNCNYSLQILNPDGSMSHTFFFLDTFDEMSEETKAQYPAVNDSKYDGAKPDQVEWYVEKAQSLKAQYGNFRSTLVLHIPLPQYRDAVESARFEYGDKLENICCTGFEPGVFAGLKDCGVTQAVFCGHDHLNNFGVYYEDILLSYIEPSGYGSYTAASSLGYEEKDWLQGYTRLVIRDDGFYETAQVRNSEGLSEK